MPRRKKLSAAVKARPRCPICKQLDTADGRQCQCEVYIIPYFSHHLIETKLMMLLFTFFIKNRRRFSKSIHISNINFLRLFKQKGQALENELSLERSQAGDSPAGQAVSDNVIPQPGTSGTVTIYDKLNRNIFIYPYSQHIHICLFRLHMDMIQIPLLKLENHHKKER